MFSDMISELTHETTDQLSNLLSRRWNEKLVYAGVGDLASPIQFRTPNKRREEYYVFQQYMKWIKLV
jgi:hypothetical protein